MTEALREVVMLPVSRRQPDFLGRAALLGSGAMHRPPLSPGQIQLRVNQILDGWNRDLYDAADLEDLFRMFARLER